MTTQSAQTAKRRDLAQDLLDQEFRKKYLHPERASTWRSLKRMYQPVLKSPRMIAASAGYALSQGLQPLLGVIVMRVLVSMLTGDSASSQSLFLAAGVYAMVYFALSALSDQLLNRNYTWFTKLRLKLLNQSLYQGMSMDFGLYENPGFMDDIETATSCFSGNTSGVEGIYHKAFEMGGTLISAMLLGGLLCWLSPLIALTGAAFVAVYYLTQAHITRYKHTKREELMRLSRQISMLSREAADFRAGKDLRLFLMAGRFRAVFDPLLKTGMRLYRAFMRREFELSFLEGLALVTTDLVSALILIERHLSGAITTADFVMLLTAVTLFSLTMQLLSKQLAFVKGEILYVQDAFDFLDANLRSVSGAGEVPADGPIGVIFDNVSFRYPGTEKWALDQLSFTIPAGQRCALVGINGAGKTTLVKLLLGLYQPTKGTIFLNGVDASTIAQDKLFSLFGVVFQEVEPLALTVAETVAASDRDVDRAQVEECLKTVGLWDKIQCLGKGIDQPLLKIIEEDGAILSGGENQKLMIARALYRRSARMMVMDEPTAALDALAEQTIYQQFETMLKGRTALFISHRLASTRFCDCILLLSGGRVAQQGTHEALLVQDGQYREMFLTQGKYYQNSVEGAQA